MSPNSRTYLNAAREVISGGDRAMRTMIGAHNDMRRYNERKYAEQEDYLNKLRQSSQIMTERLMRSGQIRPGA